MTDFTGTAGNDDYTGTADADLFDMTQGGADIVRGLDGDDVFNFGAELTADDRIFGGNGSDALVLAGDYAAPLVFDHSNFRSVEGILLFGDTSTFYQLFFEEDALAGGQTLDIDIGFGVGTLSLYAPEASAAFDVFAGDGNDSIVTGSGNDTINTGDGFNYILPGAGRDTILCGEGNDLVVFHSGEFDGRDRIDGGDTIKNIVELDGDYSGGIKLGEFTLANIQRVQFAAGNDYVIDFGKTHVAENTGMLIEGRGLGAKDSLEVNLSRVTEQLAFEGGPGDDAVIGNADSGYMRGGLGADVLEGGAGYDIYAYDTAADSTGKVHDTVVGFDPDIDIFTLDKDGFSTLGGMDATIRHGKLAAAHFESTLENAIGADQLGAAHAVVFRPDAGTLAGETFLIVDGNGAAGYQRGEDLVIHLVDTRGLQGLSAADFFMV